jgi:hypothetical protein
VRASGQGGRGSYNRRVLSIQRAWHAAPRTTLPALLLAATGCATTVVPPDDVKDPITVYLLDHGRTTSLVLPIESGAGGTSQSPALVRYTYGDWNWYALENTGTIDGLLALFWPTRGTLGRRELGGRGPGETAAAAIRRQVDEIDHVHEVRVERAALRRLTGRLESLYRANLHTAVEGKLSDLTFVHHPRPYTAFGNSNHQVSDWLRDLGCGIRGFAFFADWRVAHVQ